MKKILYTFLFLFMFVQHSFADTKLNPSVFAKTNALLSQIQKTYRSIATFQADFTQEIYHNESEHTKKTSGTFSYEKTPLVRWETLTPHKELLIVNKQAIWNYIPDEEIAYKYNPKLIDDSSNILAVLTGRARMDKDFDVEFKENVNVDGKILTQLQLYPHKPSIDLVEASIWVDPKTSYILAAKIIDFYNNSNYIKFNNFKINVKFKQSIFNFTPPKGIDIEDISDAQNFTKKELKQ